MVNPHIFPVANFALIAYPKILPYWFEYTELARKRWVRIQIKQ